MKQSTLRFTTCALALIATVAATVGTAQAVPVSGKQVCNDKYSDYRSYIAYPDRGGLATYLVEPGQCVTPPFAYENIDVYGYASSGRIFYMGRYPSWKPAANIKTAGKASNWTWWAY